MVHQLLKTGYDVVIVDNLSTGHRQAVNPQARFYEGDTRDIQFLKQVFAQEPIQAIIHMDAFSIVPESVGDPLKYFDNNVIGMIKLLEIMQQYDVKYLIFSSTRLHLVNHNKAPLLNKLPNNLLILMV